MAKKSERPGHFLREWRKERELTLEQASERIEVLSQMKASADPDVRPISMTHATLSRIERGKLPYNQHLLELLAEIYQADVASLIMRNPLDIDPIFSIWESLMPMQRRQAVEIIKALKRTGTDG